MVRNLVQKSETIDTCWAERSEVRPPLTQGPPRSTFPREQLHKQTCRHTQRHTHTHTYTYIDTNEQTSAHTEDARQNREAASRMNQASWELEFQFPSRVLTCLMFLCLGRFRVQQHPGNQNFSFHGKILHVCWVYAQSELRCNSIMGMCFPVPCKIRLKANGYLKSS